MNLGPHISMASTYHWAISWSTNDICIGHLLLFKDQNSSLFQRCKCDLVSTCCEYKESLPVAYLSSTPSRMTPDGTGQCRKLLWMCLRRSVHIFWHSPRWWARLWQFPLTERVLRTEGRKPSPGRVQGEEGGAHCDSGSFISGFPHNRRDWCEIWEVSLSALWVICWFE